MPMPFRTYTISSKRDKVSANGLHIVPDAVYGEGPTPNVVVVGAQGGRERGNATSVRLIFVQPP